MKKKKSIAKEGIKGLFVDRFGIVSVELRLALQIEVLVALEKRGFAECRNSSAYPDDQQLWGRLGQYLSLSHVLQRITT